MPKKGKSLKTIEKEKKSRLASIASGEGKIKLEDSEKLFEEQVEKDLEELKKRYAFRNDEYVFEVEKSEFLKELESMSDPEILPMPEFLIDPSETEERHENIDKLRYLLKRRFSLITIADILETNDYSKLDEIIERKDETYKAVEKYSGEDGEEHPIRLFSGFRKTVGEEYSAIYAEQEERVRAALNILFDGTYFKEAESQGENIELYIEDIIANVIDHPDFNLACQIEITFVVSEMRRAKEALSELSQRAELSEDIQRLEKIIKTIEERSHALDLINSLIKGKEGTTFLSDNKDKNEDESEKGL